jgi:preprotein translocase subunit SecD
LAPPTTTSHPGRSLLALVALILVLLLGVLAGSLFQPSQWHSRFKVGRGLDISSGTTVTLQADPPKGTSPTQLAADMATAVSIMNSRVNGAGFNGATVTSQGNNLINVTVPGKGSEEVNRLVGTTAQLRFRQVMLVAPNYAAAAVPTPTPTPTPGATPKASASPSKSSSALGEPGGSSGSHGLAVSAQRLAGASGQPKASASPKPSASPSPSPSPSPSASTAPQLATTADGQGDASLLSPAVKAQFDKLNCSNPHWKQEIYGNSDVYDNPDVQTVACYSPGPGVPPAKYALDKALVTGEMLKLGGSSSTLQTNGDWWVNLNFNAEGTKKFGQLSTEMYGKYAGSSTNPQNLFAIVLDGTPVAVPYMGAVLDTGTAQIQGSFTESQANSLSTVLNYGALPLRFTTASQQTVSAQLGSSQLQAGLLAGALGLLLVVVYAFLYYRGLGIVSISSLAIAALLSYLAVVLLSLYESFTLSLAGIAGLIVAIGITADSFVVFFERLRDEVREGKSLRAAVEHGWHRARRTILVSDTVSFLAAAVLYKFAISDVQNFAFTLGLTTLVDVIVVFLFTKPVVTLLARTEFFGGQHKWSGLDPARLGARSPWRGTRRPAARPQPGATQAGRVPGGASATAQPRTDPKEA